MKPIGLEELEARLTAQRRLLMWLVKELPADKAARLVAELWEPFPPQDAQEDPGAVPADAFAAAAGYTAEIRTILRDVRSSILPPSEDKL